MDDTGVEYEEQYSYDQVEEPTEDYEQLSPLRDQDRFLPIANVSKIMKKSVPHGGKVAKDAKECMQECVSEFISFITSESAERCQQEKRKTINGEDIVFAMNSLGFDNFIDPLKIFLSKYREANKVDVPPAIDESSSVLEDFAASVSDGGGLFSQQQTAGSGGPGGDRAVGGGTGGEEMGGAGNPTTIYVPYSTAGDYQQVTFVNGNQGQHCDASAL